MRGFAPRGATPFTVAVPAFGSEPGALARGLRQACVRERHEAGKAEASARKALDRNT